jgi:hypothetical protein
MDANKMWGELQVDFRMFFNFCYFQISSTIFMSYAYKSIIIYPIFVQAIMLFIIPLHFTLFLLPSWED